MAANANSSSTKCGSGSKSAISAQPDNVMESDVQLPDLIAYPNPVTDKVNISLKGIEAYEMIQVYSYSGMSQPVTITIRNQDLLEIDMSALSPGTYFIKVGINYTTRVFTVIRK
jgi:hypothetical protein